MPPPPPRPLWAGRAITLVGVVLLALNLRTAIAALSPILPLIGADIPLGSLGIGFLGMLPPLAFAASGFLAPLVARRAGLEATVVVACLAMVLGPVLRATAPGYAMLAVGSALVLAGMGFANILLPPIIKKYFPDRVGLLTGMYVTLMSLSASVPPLIAAPLADAVGWRVSTGAWAVFALGALLPWLAVWLRHRGVQRQALDAGALPEPSPALLGRMRHSRVAWGITIAFAITSLNAYAMFAWLPELLVATAGVSSAQAGALLALYGIMGLPLGLLAPVLATRVSNVALVIAAAIACFVLGYLGLLLAPTVLTPLWVVLIGSGPLLFPLCLVLLNLRTRSHEGSIALSGFVQGIGYALGALGPIMIGVAHDLSGSWTIPLIVLLASSLLVAVSALLLRRPRFVEDELAAPAAG